jgi:hypothetical protein
MHVGASWSDGNLGRILRIDKTRIPRIVILNINEGKRRGDLREGFKLALKDKENCPFFNEFLTN